MLRWIWKNKWKLAAVYTCSVLAAVPLAFHLYVTRTMLPKTREAFTAGLRKHHDAILADLRSLEATPLFGPPARARNAEPFISAHAGWEGGIKDASHERDEKFEALLKRYSKWKSDHAVLTALLQDPEMKTFDLSWVARLTDFDHWDLSTRADYAAELDRAKTLNSIGRIAVLASIPVPNYMVFRDAVELHALQLAEIGRARKGAALLHKAAQLAHSSGVLVGQMIAVTLLQAERDFAAAGGLKDWAAPSEELIKAYRRASWAAVALAQSTWFSDLPQEFQPYIKAENGFCAGAWESAMGLASMQDFLGPRAPFETDFSSDLERSARFQHHLFEICGMTAAYAPLLEPAPPGSNPWMSGATRRLRDVASEEARQDVMLNPSRIPYLRRVAGMVFLSIATPNWLGLYERD